MVATSFPAEGRDLNFLGVGYEECFYCIINPTLLSGSKWWTHFLSSVTICYTNLTGSDSKADVVMRREWPWSVRFLGTHLADTFDIFRWSWIMAFMLPREIYSSRDLLYFYSHVISNQFLHSSNYRWNNSIRWSAGPRVTFERLMSTPKLIRPSGNYAVRRYTVPVHGTQSIMNFLCCTTFFTKKLND